MKLRKAIGVAAVMTCLSVAGPARANLTLDSFTFYIDDQSGADSSIDFIAEVYAWSGSLTGGSGAPQGAVGPALFTSAVMNWTDPDGVGIFTPITINTGGLDLAPGNYIALLTSSGLQANHSGATRWGNTLVAHAPNSGGGGFNFFNNDDNHAIINNGDWDDFADIFDLAWKAVFNGGAVAFDTTSSWNGTSSVLTWGIPNTATYGQTFVVAVPEPTSLALFAAGALALAGFRRRSTSRDAH